MKNEYSIEATQKEYLRLTRIWNASENGGKLAVQGRETRKKGVTNGSNVVEIEKNNGMRILNDCLTRHELNIVNESSVDLDELESISSSFLQNI